MIEYLMKEKAIKKKVCKLHDNITEEIQHTCTLNSNGCD